VVAPGSRVGKGVLVRAFSYVSGVVPDFAIVAGQPARVVGDTRAVDGPWLDAHPDLRADYDSWTQGQGTARRLP
jgi:serine acetyltransferase